MKQAIRIDSHGYFIEDVLVEDEFESTREIITDPCENGFYKPMWNGNGWEEGLSEQEIEEIQNQPSLLSELDIIGMQLVQRELESLEIRSENNMLGEQLVAIDLRLLSLEGGSL